MNSPRVPGPQILCFRKAPLRQPNGEKHRPTVLQAAMFTLLTLKIHENRSLPFFLSQPFQFIQKRLTSVLGSYRMELSLQNTRKNVMTSNTTKESKVHHGFVGRAQPITGLPTSAKIIKSNTKNYKNCSITSTFIPECMYLCLHTHTLYLSRCFHARLPKR